jgi:hypothetical protein
MTKQYDTEEQIEAFDAYVKRNPAGRQVHHTGTLGYEEDEWHAFQEGWNAALAQPAQEPVAHVYLFDHDGKPRVAWDNAKGIKIGDRLYTTPPQREWVGLTDEDTFKIAERLGLSDVAWVDLMQAIEAALRSKNT